MADKVRWEMERPVDCQSCIGQGNHANTPRILVENNQDYQGGAPRGGVACRWCGYEVTAPSLSEAIHKWNRFQQLFSIAYTIQKNDNCEGCIENGKWENEKEAGLPSPCTACRRMASDNYQKEEYKIIVLSGSTKFKEDYDRVARQLDAEGYIVWSCVTFSHAEGVELTPEEIKAHNEKHRRKIELCDEIFIINKDGYIGESTQNEIAYANSLGKKIRYMEGKINVEDNI